MTAVAPWAEAATQGAYTCPITPSSDDQQEGGGRCLCSHGCTDEETKKKMHLKVRVQNSKAVTETNCHFCFIKSVERVVIL